MVCVVAVGRFGDVGVGGGGGVLGVAVCGVGIVVVIAVRCWWCGQGVGGVVGVLVVW